MLLFDALATNPYTVTNFHAPIADLGCVGDNKDRCITMLHALSMHCFL